MLKGFTHKEEEHNGNTLAPLTDDHCADGCQGHKELFIQKITANKSLCRTYKYPSARYGKGDEIKSKGYVGFCVLLNNKCRNEENKSNYDFADVTLNKGNQPFHFSILTPFSKAVAFF